MAEAKTVVADSPAHRPFIPAEAAMREFSLRALVTGVVLGVIFGASSLYLALKVGLTVSASIPVAVISLAVFRGWSRLGGRDATILENNLTQTAGSAGESIAFGVAVTMPAIMILGFDLEVGRVFLVAALGAVLGILMMIPLRRTLIVREHATLKYPEGTACATVLMAGANEEDRKAASKQDESLTASATSGGVIFAGFFIGLTYKVANIAVKGWKDVSEKIFGPPFSAGSVSVEVAPELLGVGYIIGPKIASLMCAGGVLAYLVLIPMIRFFGQNATGPIAPGTTPIASMAPDDIRGAYVLYIGAGAVAAGGIVSLIRSLPVIWGSIRHTWAATGKHRGRGAETQARTDRDLSIKLVGIGIIVLVTAIALVPALHMHLVGAVLIVLFGFLFVAVSSRLTGEIGNSSNPVSGMTVATLLLTCLIFLCLGWTGRPYYVTALSVGAIVCIAATNAGATSQDLKTGYLLGATPRLQQIAIVLGALASAAALGPILTRLNDSATVYVPIAQVAPAGLRTDPGPLQQREHLAGPQAASDRTDYRVWQKTDFAGGPSGKYLVDDRGRAVWFVDPGINGRFHRRPDGSEVRKFDAPKATLMSYIIKGILDRQLPWPLVLFGVMIALTLEMCGMSSLAFAVGVYLPLSSSTPIWAGGIVRWLVDRHRRKSMRPRENEPLTRTATPEEITADSDRSPGVLLASGYIAGGAIAGIVIALLAGVLEPTDAALTRWAERVNPFYQGPHADLLSFLPFILIAAILHQVGKKVPSHA